MMVYTSPRLSALVLVAIPFIVFPLIASGARCASARARRRIRWPKHPPLPVSRSARSARAGLQWRPDRQRPLFGCHRRCVRRGAGGDPLAFHPDGRGDLHGVRQHCRGALVWRARRTRWHDVGGHAWAVRALCGGCCIEPWCASEVWGEIAQASGAAERLSELLAEVPAIRAPANPKRFPATAAGAIAFNDVRFAYPSRRNGRP